MSNYDWQVSQYIEAQRDKAAIIIDNVIDSHKEICNYTTGYSEKIDLLKEDLMRFTEWRNLLSPSFPASKEVMSLFASQVSLKYDFGKFSRIFEHFCIAVGDLRCSLAE